MSDMVHADDDIREMVLEIYEQHHSRLEVAEVVVQTMFHNDSADKPLKLNGYQCAALIRKTSLRERRCGIRADAVLVIDPFQWGQLSEESKRALIDHELTHLVPVRNPQTGDLVYDKDGRPKLKMRLHDVQFGWFDEVRQRHGEHSLERMQHDSINRRYEFTQETLKFSASA